MAQAVTLSGAMVKVYFGGTLLNELDRKSKKVYSNSTR